ncbi:hypothetical protein BZZ01_08010 [Nostocales cyanobacterium HT-58-2]|nr:hypothetical protein BZZ01_08010 [Nostocales cyanobacterium HT-58-2]
MSCRSFWLTLGTCLVIGEVLALSGKSTLAQSNIAADNTLGTETTVVTPNVNIKNIPSESISGGATRGVNLLHSFREFNVDSGRGVYFINPAGIENILTRVTGTNPSKILGTLGVLGNANLFLMNPNGIIFGQNARLDIGGSFVGTTANSIGLTNGDIFNANPLDPLPSQLLNVNPNAFLFNQIANQQSHSIQVNKATLSVPQTQSLLLLGGNVSLDNGKLQAPNGAVELGGVAGSGRVGFEIKSNPSFKFPSNLQKADLSLTNEASIDVTDKGAGRVNLTARNIDMSAGSRILAGIGKGLTAVNSPGGDVTLNATGTVNINQQSRIVNVVNSGGTGNAGNINIRAGDIFINNVARKPNSKVDPALSTEPYIDRPTGKGAAGNVSLEATGSISLTGQDVSPEDKVISTFSIRDGLGGGDISLKANGSISLFNAFLVSSSFSDVRGAGNISLQGNESVSLSSNSQLAAISFNRGDSGNITIQSNGPVSLRNSFLLTEIGSEDPRFLSARGNAGDITIDGRSVSILAGSLVSSRANSGERSGSIQINAQELLEISGKRPFPGPLNPRRKPEASELRTRNERRARGAAGNISINVSDGTFRISDGGSLTADTLSAYRGGNITIRGREIELTHGGQFLTSTSSSGDAGDIDIQANKISITHQTNDPKAITGIFANTSRNATGKGGNVKMTSGQLTVDGSQVTVSSQGRGSAGSLFVRANSIQLNNGKLQASTTSGEGGNIDLQVQDFMLMRRNSLISAEALNSANGGDITINAANGFIVSGRDENSDIIANADQGKGGRIAITSLGVYGLETRPQLTNLSDINASSQAGLNGTVEINDPSIDPSQGLVNLPVDIVEPKVSQVCQAGRGQKDNRFAITGRGGLPANPTEPLMSDAVIANWIILDSENETRSTQGVSKNLNAPTSQQIVEASGWVINAQGEVFLTADASTVTPHSSWHPATHCTAAQ